MRFQFSGPGNDRHAVKGPHLLPEIFRKAVGFIGNYPGTTVELPGLYTDRARSAISNRARGMADARIRAYCRDSRLAERQALMQEQDPLAVIARHAPRFSDEAAIEIAKERYGLDVTVRTLVSERDQNFRMRATDGAEYVFKIANAAEAAEVTEFQIEALLHIADAVRRRQIPIKTPQIVKTLDGETHVTLRSPDGRHIARVVSFLPGVPLGERIASPMLACNMGVCLAHLGRALADFSHPGSQQSLLWDVQRAPELRRLVRHVARADVKTAVLDALDDFEIHALPRLSSLRSQIIHSDFNADNVLIDTQDSDAVAGVIDFGDMLRAPLIVDVAIGAAYLREPDGDPLRLIAEFVAGYHGVTPLLGDELDILFELLKARLSASIAILDWRASERGADDPYLARLADDDASAGSFLCRLREIPREHARRVFSQVCASTPGDQTAV